MVKVNTFINKAATKNISKDNHLIFEKLDLCFPPNKYENKDAFKQTSVKRWNETPYNYFLTALLKSFSMRPPLSFPPPDAACAAFLAAFSWRALASLYIKIKMFNI